MCRKNNPKIKYNPDIHHRRSIRLKGYDYSWAGLYFITICCQNNACLFGEIHNGEMILNDAGKMIEKWYHELEHKYPDKRCDEMVVMPNHFHCIIENIPDAVGADLRVCPPDICLPDMGSQGEPISGKQISGKPTLGEPILGEHTSGEHTLGEHIGSPLHRAVQWFKTMTTNEYIRGVKSLGWQPFDRKLWQRDYYEHIIRNIQSYQNIVQYIINNPKNWENDKMRIK